MRTIPLSPDLELRVETRASERGALVDVRLHRRDTEAPAGAAFIPVGGFLLPGAEAAELGAALLAAARAPGGQDAR